MIVEKSEKVTLLGAGLVTPQDVKEALGLAPNLVAADGGAAQALDMGLMPSAVIGDFDSIDTAVRARIPDDRLHEIAEQESTDFEKCLSNIAAPLVIAVGFTGGRLDHELAVFSVLARSQPCVVVGTEDVVFAAPREVSLALDPGTRLSLFPMAPVTGRSEGLRWPINGLALSPAGRIGTSNLTTGPVRLAFDAPGMLVILPRDCLRPAVAALAGR